MGCAGGSIVSDVASHPKGLGSISAAVISCFMRIRHTTIFGGFHFLPGDSAEFKICPVTQNLTQCYHILSNSPWLSGYVGNLRALSLKVCRLVPGANLYINSMAKV